LVEGQDHNQIAESLSTYLQSLSPKQVNLSIKKLAGCNAVTTNTNTMAYLAAKEALEKNFSASVSNTRIGGSIPVVSFIKDLLKVETVLMGFGLDSDQIHAPNESFSIHNYFKGIETLMDFFELYSLKTSNNPSIATTNIK
jgi:acetylornithine deacetylase/succinyl-diaminopimelate desuccinylase-like protein